MQVTNRAASGPVVLVCEHASNHIPATLKGLGLSLEVQQSHVAWDPGAIEVAQRLSSHLAGPLVAGRISRLVYDCNRPPAAPDAMPAKSELFEIPGNAGLSDADRAIRVRRYYDPFRAALAQTLTAVANPVLVTIHSFTPVYLGQRRAVDVGVLHDTDSRLADQMLGQAARHTDLTVARNQPYGPEHGVTHTLIEHGLAGGLPNVMLEIRNDRIATDAQQDAIAQMLAGWLGAALAGLGVAISNEAPCNG